MHAADSADKFLTMTRSPVEPLICRLAVPTIVSSLVTTFYNVADTYFIGRISTSASAAVGVSFSLMAVIQAVGFFFGQGSGNNISKELGKRHAGEAEILASVGFFSALAAGALIMAAGLLFLEPLAAALGSTETILPYSTAYMRLILIGAPWMTASLVLNNQLRFEGSAFYGMIGLGSGAVLNIVLDPLLIFTCGMGIAGAALATVVSQFVSFTLLFCGCRFAGNVPIRVRNFRPSFRVYRMIANGGTPSLCRQGIACIAVICLNTAAKPFGDAAIAAMAIVSRITHFTNFALIGFGQGFQPVCGFNYGAKLYDRVRRAFWFCVKVTAVFLTVLAVVEYLAAPALIELFRKGDPEVTRIGTTALRLQCLTFPLAAWMTISNMMMQTTGKVFRASFLGLARQGVFLIPFVLLLPPLIGVLGVQAAQPVADLISFAVSIPLQCSLLRGMRREQEAFTTDQSAGDGN
ncbi:MAG: MATE family efflux transporter [Lentisphaeria bacterium]|nr:MATE family efflux transporter [Lentisphaeria bacterium]